VVLTDNSAIQSDVGNSFKTTMCERKFCPNLGLNLEGDVFETCYSRSPHFL